MKIKYPLVSTLFAIFLCLAGFRSQAQTNVIPDEVELAVLKNIYDSLGGPNWTNKTNWPTAGNWPATATSAQFGTWHGIVVRNGDIEEIRLATNNLIGIFPTSITQLERLEFLRLNSNKISGSLPPSIKRLTSLATVFLYGNLMSGPIPVEIGDMVSLTLFDVGNNSFDGDVPSSISTLPNLATLSLSFNKFTSIPDLSGLTNLRTLRINNNGQLQPGPLPSWLQNLTNLEYLDFSFGKRNGDLSVLYGLTNLEQLYLNNNQLTGPIAPAIGSLNKLTTLYLYQNQLSGTIPSEIGNLTLLNVLALFTNQLSGSIPESIGNLTNLTSLQLQQNQLTGTIPSTVGNISSLQTLHLGSNQLTGSIPASLGNLTFLIVLNLSNNQLTGSIPASFTNMFRASNVQLQFNQLTGPLPATMGSMTNLSWFYAHNNQLTGELPASIGSLPLLYYLNLATNKLSGNLPSTLGNLPSLTYLYLNSNQFTGELPSSLGNLTKLEVLSVNTNLLTGSIPSSLAGLTKLHTFNVGHNRLSGALTFIGNYTNLNTLVLEDNQFTGDFPDQIGNCTKLVSVYGEYNKFTSLPDTMLTLPVLVNTRFTNNELTNIPPFQSHVNKTNLKLYVINNRLDYSHLEPIATAGLSFFTYSGQQPKDITTLSVTLGQAFTIQSRPGNFTTMTWEKFNGYTWQSVNTQNEDATQRTFKKTVVTASDQGLYRWTMTNTAVAGTTVQSAPIEVKTNEQLILDTWAFQYMYDSRQRMVGKKVPGADWVYMVYDNRDRLVMTQDGELRKSHKWNFTKYDALNRPIITGIYTHTGWVTQSAMAGLISTTNFFETYNGSGLHGYTNNVFPTGTQEILTVTYYDNYDFKSLVNDSEFDYAANEIEGQYAGSGNGVAFDRVINQVTAQKTKVLTSKTVYLWSVNYFDDKGRNVQTVAENIKNGIDRTTSVYDFTGKVLKSKTSHSSYEMTWQNLAGLKWNGASLVSSLAGWNNRASSVEALPAGSDGWVEMTVADMELKWLGFDPQFTTYENLDYSVYINQGLRIYENYINTFNGTISIGDKVRIERINGTIYYKKNGVVVYTSTVPSSGDLIANLQAYGTIGAFEDLRGSFQKKQGTIDRTFVYDHADRLKETWHSVNGQTPVLIARNDYNELGQLIQKKLHSTDAVASQDNTRTYKQNLDYRYNIRGWLERINNSDLAKEDVNNSAEPKDYFGMNLGYNESIGLATVDGQVDYQFNGNISAIKYSTNLGLGINIDDGDLQIVEPTERGYRFEYDALNRLTSANHIEKTTAWGNTTSFNESIPQYDLNGNIKNLSRTEKDGSSAMDQLTYTYLGNQLLKVADSGNKQDGFKDSPSIDDDYAYDANGNMTMDRNKSINPSGIKYNFLNLPQEVIKSTSEKIVYVYDATGRKLTQNVFNAAGAVVKKTNYVGEYIYENDTAKIILHDEGRIIPETDGTFTYDYNLKDHLGNSRLTFTTKHEVEETTATLETANIAEEQSKYLRYENARLVQSTLFDRTNGASPGYAQRLTGTGNEVYGLARSLSVMPGDTIHTEVYAKYAQPDAGNSQALNDFIAALAAATLPAGTIIDGGGYAQSTSSFSYGGIVENSPTENAPKAYLNWIVFDRDFNPKDMGFMAVTTAARENGTDGPHERLFKDNLVIREPGYVYIYVSNENEVPVEVFFDDFSVEHIKGPVVQVDEYYPFGLAFNSYQHENSVEQRYKFQGQEHVDELDLGWDAFKWRNHQPDIGRFFNNDPLAEDYYYNSPYAFSENKVVAHRELEGLESKTIHEEALKKEIGKIEKAWDNFVSKFESVVEKVADALTVPDEPEFKKVDEMDSDPSGTGPLDWSGTTDAPFNPDGKPHMRDNDDGDKKTINTTEGGQREASADGPPGDVKIKEVYTDGGIDTVGTTGNVDKDGNLYNKYHVIRNGKDTIDERGYVPDRLMPKKTVPARKSN